LEATADDEEPTTLRAIKALSRHGCDPEKSIRYTCTGWQQVDNHWQYLMPDGAITSNGITTTVRAEIDPKIPGNH
jgi:hypothetical protein